MSFSTGFRKCKKCRKLLFGLFDGEFCEECEKTMTTLEKIKAEIEEKEKNTIDWSRSVGLIDALEIIDKYAEQEPTTGQSCENCKILELLVDFELETICEDDGKDFEYCENNCDFKAPTKECYLHWAEHKRKVVSE